MNYEMLEYIMKLDMSLCVIASKLDVMSFLIEEPSMLRGY